MTPSGLQPPRSIHRNHPGLLPCAWNLRLLRLLASKGPVGQGRGRNLEKSQLGWDGYLRILLEEIIKQPSGKYKTLWMIWDIYLINWCRIFSINNRNPVRKWVCLYMKCEVLKDSKGYYSKLRAVYFAHINSGQMEYVTNLDSTEIRGPISLPKCYLFGGLRHVRLL